MAFKKKTTTRHILDAFIPLSKKTKREFSQQEHELHKKGYEDAKKGLSPKYTFGLFDSGWAKHHYMIGYRKGKIKYSKIK